MLLLPVGNLLLSDVNIYNILRNMNKDLKNISFRYTAMVFCQRYINLEIGKYLLDKNN